MSGETKEPTEGRHPVEPGYLREVMDKAAKKKYPQRYLDKSNTIDACMRRITRLEERVEYAEERAEAIFEILRGIQKGNNVDAGSVSV